MNSTRVLLTVGDLLEDVVVVREAEAGAVLRRGTDNAATVVRTRGGSAANVAAAAADLVAVRFVGRVGDDRLGHGLVDELAARGVDVRVQWGDRTGTIVVLVDADGERTMITDRGAAAHLTAIDPSVLDAVGWLHVPLYGLAVPEPAAAIIELCHTASQRSIPVSVDASSVALIDELGLEVARRLLADLSPTVLFANADEAIALQIDAHGPPLAPTVVIKRGADPVEVITANGVASVPVEPVADVRDTTGAGDAFAAGFLAATLGGADPVAAAHAGSRRAAATLASAGAW